MKSTAIVSAAVLAVSALGVAAPGRAAAPGHTTMPATVPSATTPGFGNGKVSSIVQVGSTVIAGGTFDNVTPPGGAQRGVTGVAAFNASTGRLVDAFDPQLNGDVEKVLAGPTPGTVYLAGSFTQVDGQGQSHVTLLDISSGEVVDGFRPAATNGRVNTLATSAGRLLLGGTFTTAGGQAHRGLASLNPTTGRLDAWMDVDVTGHHNDTGSGAQGAVGVREMEATSTGERIAVVGNFKQADGLARDQLVVLDATSDDVSVDADWRTRRYEPYCYSWAFDSYMRGVAVSPDDSYFVVTTTGGGNQGTLCDAASRFEFDSSGQDVQPTWASHSGGDTLWGVDVTENAVYVGGHQRWMNNSQGRDSNGAGSVPRPGLAALDPDSGLPLSWNPGRNPRGTAAFAVHATPSGLWVGSDTQWVGNRQYRRARLAFFPLAGGSAPAAAVPASLPGSVYLAGSRAAGQAGNGVRTVAFDGDEAGPASTADSLGVDWGAVRGAFVLDDTLFYAHTDGYLHRRTFTGSEVGTDQRIDPYNDPFWSNVDTGSNNTYRGRVPDLYGQLSGLTGMFYDADRVYYTRSGRSALYWRWFNADSGVVGSETYTAGGGRDWSDTGGLFLDRDKLYVVSAATGRLTAVPFDGQPQGAGQLVGGTLDWRANAVFIGPGGSEPPQNEQPTAAFTVDCDELTCEVDASASDDPDGDVTAYSWSFGDGATATGETATHAYAEAGRYTITLEVTDDEDATATATRQVDVEDASPAGDVEFRASASATGNHASPSLVVPASVEAGDVLVLVGSYQSGGSASDPSGWTRVDSESASGMDSVVWTRTATATDAGTRVSTPLGKRLKFAMTLGAYSGADDVEAASSTGSHTTEHAAPSIDVANGAWVIEVWTDKSSGTTAWTPPAGVRVREEAVGAGGGRMSALYADSGSPVGTGSAGGHVATTDAASARAIAWTIAVSPGG